MKSTSAFTYLIPLFFLIFIFVSCDTDENPVGTLEEAVERIPDVQPIQGAENATINVRNDRDRSYFKVSIDNTSGFDGVYNAWCVQMNVSLQRGVEHPETRLYATDGDKEFNQLSYIVNTRNRYERELEDLSWREIQVAMWVILETQDYNLAAIESRIPSSVEGYNSTYVNEILKDVQTNGSNFEPGPLDTRLFYYEIQNNQDGVGEQTAWAWAADNSDSFRYLNLGQQWGWVLYYQFDALDGGLYAGCGFGTEENPEPEDLDSCTLVGGVSFSDDDVNLSIVVNTINNWYMTNLQVYVGAELPSSLAPGGFPYKKEGIFSQSEDFTIPLSDFESEDPPALPDTLYIAVHADVEQ